MDQEEYKALLDTFQNLQIATQRAVSRLQTLRPQPVRVVEQELHPRIQVKDIQFLRIRNRDALEGNGADEQFGLKKKDIVHITNSVNIGLYTLEESQKTGSVRYFTDWFVVVNLKYKECPSDKEFNYKLVKRERHNVKFIRSNI